jgi:hypothetical protein
MEIRFGAVFALEVKCFRQSSHFTNGRVRHPNVWQLFGISTTAGLHALIYYDGTWSHLRSDQYLDNNMDRADTSANISPISPAIV